jgi:serine/threonine protein kinase
MELTQGQRLGHYRIDGTIGRGGMGSVYRATDTRLEREVAIKVLPAGVTADVERRQRFRQEALLAAAFNHPNIATVHDVGEQERVTFIVMELVRGESLRRLIGCQPLDIGRAIDIATGIAAGLARAHREGVLHRDLKPDNVVLTDDGVPKILDFGLGKLIGDVDPQDGGPLAEAPTATVQSSPYLTRAGQVIGTLAYMSPEQVHGRPVDARSDVFSFGVLLYEMLSGTRVKPRHGDGDPARRSRAARRAAAGRAVGAAGGRSPLPGESARETLRVGSGAARRAARSEARARDAGRRPRVAATAPGSARRVRPACRADRRRGCLVAPPQLAGVVGP